MAQDGPVAGGEHGREVPRVAIQHRVADGVHAAVDPVQPPGGDSPFNRTTIDADRGQLPASDNAVLRPRELRKALIWAWGCKCTHTVH